MEAREEPHDPGYDDWFDEPDPPTETQSGANRGVNEETEEVWVLPAAESARSGGGREIVIGGRTLTTTQLAIIAVSILAVVFAILAAAGIFNGGKAPTPTVTPPPKKITVTVATTTTAASTNPTIEAPAQTLGPGDTGAQVKVLQRALKHLGFDPGTPDGDYGVATKVAVERFQIAKGLSEDGVVGPETLNALQKALSG
jgi:Putative peptidoglycan binding domain